MAAIPLRPVAAFGILLPLMASMSFAGGRQPPEQMPSPRTTPLKAAASPSPRNPVAAYDCMKTAAKDALARGLVNPDWPTIAQDALENYAAKACVGQPPNSATLPYAMAAASEALSDWEKAHPEKEVERQRERVRQEAEHGNEMARQQADLKAELNSLETVYYKCLFERSAVLARASTEPAETLVRATLAACRAQRSEVVSAYGRHGEQGGEEIMVDFDLIAENDLILNIIAERAREPAPAPARPLPAKPRETPL